MIATDLPDVLLSEYRHNDGIRAAERGLAACRAIGDAGGEGNTLRSLGDLKVRTNDLAGARADYDAALLIYREIRSRLGEGYTLRSLERLKRSFGWLPSGGSRI